jgi:proton-coupled amino acid transporter
MLHYKACADTKRKKAADIAIIVFGLVAAAYTTIQTVKVRSVSCPLHSLIELALPCS